MGRQEDNFEYETHFELMEDTFLKALKSGDLSRDSAKFGLMLCQTRYLAAIADALKELVTDEEVSDNEK